MRHRPAGATGPHLGFVGKAVTFDTGGISIKPSAKMHEMKFDMSGGAAVIEAIAGIARLGLPATVTAVVPATENMPSGRSVKPGDIVTAMNGKTIEVNNTDAEGRLISPMRSAAVEQGVERIVDLATLTGAIVALGHTFAGLFANDDDWYEQVAAACTATGELGWRMPLHPEYLELTKGQYADLTNAAEQRVAMSCYAAEFLGQFVDGRPWLHMDIAGTAWGMSRPYVGKGVRRASARARSSSWRDAAAGAEARRRPGRAPQARQDGSRSACASGRPAERLGRPAERVAPRRDQPNRRSSIRSSWISPLSGSRSRWTRSARPLSSPL